MRGRRRARKRMGLVIEGLYIYLNNNGYLWAGSVGEQKMEGDEMGTI